MTNDWQSMLSSLRDGLPEGEEPATHAAEAPKNKGKLTVSMEKKGRGGKTATIIAGFTESDDEIAALASQLKSKLGTGGSARGGEILIQGDRREDVKQLLKNLGYRV